MTVNLAWRDAMAVAAAYFTRQEHGAGWQANMATGQLAALQRPYAYGDSKGRRACWALRDELADACKAGAIEHTSTTERVQTAPAIDLTPISLTQNWPSQYCGPYGEPRGYTSPAQFKEVTHHRITAPAFATWLAAQGQEPSPHIDAWFTAVGTPTAPAETTAERNARWLLVWDKESPVHAKGSQARAIEVIAAAEGVAPDTAKAALQRANKARATSQRAAGVVPMKRGKNTANDPFNRVPPKATARR